MNFPVNASDFVDVVDSDEIATLIVVESIVSGTFENLDFIDSVDPGDVRSKVTTWDQFDEYAHTISEQKALLTSVLPNNYNIIPDLTEADLLDSTDIATSVISERKTTQSSQRKYKYVMFSAAAASILFVALGLFVVSNSNNTDVTASKSSKTSEIPSSSGQKSSSDVNEYQDKSVAGAPRAVPESSTDTKTGLIISKTSSRTTSPDKPETASNALDDRSENRQFFLVHYWFVSIAIAVLMLGGLALLIRKLTKS